MGEKSGGLWLIVIVVVLAGLLIFSLAQFFPGAIDIVGVKLMDTMIEAGLALDRIPGIGDGVEPPVAE